jgi:hypothetical protein
VISLDSPDEGTCDNILNMNPPEPDDSTTDSDFTIRTSVGRDASIISAADVIAFLNMLRLPIALHVAGCEDEAKEFLSRRLDDKKRIDYAEMMVWEEYGKLLTMKLAERLHILVELVLTRVTFFLQKPHLFLAHLTVPRARLLKPKLPWSKMGTFRMKLL